MSLLGRAYLAAVEAWTMADRDDADGFRAAGERLRAAEAALAATPEGRAFFSAPMADLESIGAVAPSEQEDPGMPTVTVDAASWAELQRQAAAAPALVEQARLVQAGPVRRAGEGAPVTAFAAPQPGPSEAALDEFVHGMGMGGHPRPVDHLRVVDPRYPGGVPPTTAQLSGGQPSQASLDAFVAGLGLGARSA